jgi:hypothetical protein
MDDVIGLRTPSGLMRDSATVHIGEVIGMRRCRRACPLQTEAFCIGGVSSIVSWRARVMDVLDRLKIYGDKIEQSV